MAEQKRVSKKKGCLGCSLPIAISLVVVVIAISVVGIVNGAFGKKLIPPPQVELPAEVIAHVGSGTPVMLVGQQIYPFPITNTLITSWITILILILLALLVTNRSKLIPGRLQGAVEMVIEYMYNFCKDVAGEKKGRTFFPIVTTIFLFVLINALMNLVPGYGTITFNTHEGTIPLLRGANTDINTALSLALISFACVTFWGIKANKMGFFKTFFNFGRFFRGWGDVFRGKVKPGCGAIVFGVIDIFVGILELFSYFIRIISFTFRLFGNMTGGEILILIVFFLLGFSGIASVAYAFEMLVGVVQALIFAGLTLVFATMATESHESEEH